MAGEYKPNQKLDDSPYDADRSTPEYPNVFGEVDVLGHSRVRYADQDNPDKAFYEEINYDGSFESTETNGLHRNLKLEVRSYTSGGHSHHTDGQHAEYTESNKNIVARQDIGLTAGGSTYKGSGEKEISGTSQGTFNYDTGVGVWRSPNGDMVHDVDGYYQINANTNYQIVSPEIYIHASDQINLTAAANVDLMSGGKLAIGSLDAMLINSSSTMNLLSTGAMAINSSATMTVGATGDITVTSQSKITFTVGSSSITMQDGLISIKATKIALN